MWAPLFPGEPFDYATGPNRSPEYNVALYDTSLSIEVKRASAVSFSIDVKYNPVISYEYCTYYFK